MTRGDDGPINENFTHDFQLEYKSESDYYSSII